MRQNSRAPIRGTSVPKHDKKPRGRRKSHLLTLKSNKTHRDESSSRNKSPSHKFNLPRSTSRCSNNLVMFEQNKSSMHSCGTLNKHLIDKQRSTQLDNPNVLDKKSLGQRSQVVENVTHG